ncbi:hypothetical protein [Streptomyces sp. NPDC002746]
MSRGNIRGSRQRAAEVRDQSTVAAPDSTGARGTSPDQARRDHVLRLSHD